MVVFIFLIFWFGYIIGKLFSKIRMLILLPDYEIIFLLRKKIANRILDLENILIFKWINKIVC